MSRRHHENIITWSLGTSVVVIPHLGYTIDARITTYPVKHTQFRRRFVSFRLHDQLKVIWDSSAKQQKPNENVFILGFCVFPCVSRCLSGRFNNKFLVPRKHGFTDIGAHVGSCNLCVAHHRWRHQIEQQVKFWNFYNSVSCYHTE